MEREQCYRMEREMGGRSKLEEKVREGLYGEPELRKEEKKRYLGEFEERVLRYLTAAQVSEPYLYPEIVEALRDPRAEKIIISRQVELAAADRYLELARENGLLFKRVDSPRLAGEVGLVVVSGRAVEAGEKAVPSRQERLQERGISDKIIRNVGQKLCLKCWSELAEKAPEELENYQKMSWLDAVLGTECVCKHK